MFLSECEEADVRSALNDAATLYFDSPEECKERVENDHMIDIFMSEELPGVSPISRKMAGGLIFTTLSSVGNSFSLTMRTKGKINSCADAMSDMFYAYIKIFEVMHCGKWQPNQRKFNFKIILNL